MTVEDVFDLAAKVPFDFQNQTADPLLFVTGFVSKNLFRKGEHAATGFPAAHGAKDRGSRKQSALRNGEPIGVLGGFRFARIVHFSDDQE